MMTMAMTASVMNDNSEDEEHWQNNYWMSSFDPCVVVYLIQNLNYGN